MADQGDSVTFTGFLDSSPGDDPLRLCLDPERTQEIQVAAADVTGTEPADGGLTYVHVLSDAPVRYQESSTGAEMLGGTLAATDAGPFDFTQPAAVLARSNPPRACQP